jgi:CheY-like chemotaxis protein
MQSGAQYDVVIAQHNPSDISDVDLATALKTGTTQPLPEIILLHNRIDDLEILKRAGALPIKSILQKPVRYQDLIIALSDLYANITEKNVSNGIPKKADLHRTRELSILMVEDNLVNMILLKRILQRILPTARLIEAGNGLVAVNICEQELPDIIFMDVQMPVMDGLEATKTIRSIKGAEGLPIIALTAGNEKGAMQECLNAGMSHFLTKPYTPKDLEKVLEEFELV